jgi:hypothetical protein
MAEFGKRRSAQDAGTFYRPTAEAVDLGAAIKAVQTGRLPYWAKAGPLYFVTAMIFAAGVFWLHILPYAEDLLRDHRHMGTWQPAYDMRVIEGRCTRYGHVISDCRVKIESAPEPNKAPLTIRYSMFFASGGGELLLPMRSTVDPSAITVAYAAETKLVNRTLTFLGMTGVVAAVFFGALGALRQGRFVGGAAHRALVAGLMDLKARAGNAHADERAGF